MAKLLTTITLVLFTCSSLPSQDLLVKNNGDTLSIEVIEIKTKYLIYHKLPDKDKKVFTTSRKKLNKIIYSNGDIFLFANETTPEKTSIDDPRHLYIRSGFWGPKVGNNYQDLSEKQVIHLYQEIDNLHAEKLYRKGRSQIIWGNIFAFPSGYLLGGQIYNALSSKAKVNTSLLAVAIGGTVISFSLSTSGVKKVKKSVSSYNESLDLTFGTTQNGIGLTYTFD